MDSLHVLSNKSSTVDTPDVIEYMAKVATLAKPQSRLFHIVLQVLQLHPMSPYRSRITLARKLAHIPHPISQTACNQATSAIRNAVEIDLETAAKYTKIAVRIYL
jgi:hypothetical protein